MTNIRYRYAQALDKVKKWFYNESHKIDVYLMTYSKDVRYIVLTSKDMCKAPVKIFEPDEDSGCESTYIDSDFKFNIIFAVDYIDVCNDQLLNILNIDKNKILENF